MTAQRPYRMTPLTAEQALGELRKFAGIQFDPKVVDAFVKTSWVEGVNDPGRTVQPRPIPLISQHANRSAANGGRLARASGSGPRRPASGTAPSRSALSCAAALGAHQVHCPMLIGGIALGLVARPRPGREPREPRASSGSATCRSCSSR